MRVLVVGGGGREHALAWKLASSDRVSGVLSAPGSPGMAELGPTFDVAVDDLAGLADDLAALAGELSEDWHVERPDDVRTMAYADAEGRVRVVFVVSDADRSVTAVVLADEHAKALRDPLAQETLRVDGGKLAVAMQPRGVRMLVVE